MQTPIAKLNLVFFSIPSRAVDPVHRHQWSQRREDRGLRFNEIHKLHNSITLGEPDSISVGGLRRINFNSCFGFEFMFSLDSRSRALYDSVLIASRHDTIVAEDICLEDVMAEDVGEAVQLFYQCRCGDYYSVDSLELEKMGYALLRDGSKLFVEAQNALPAALVLPCGSCSLKVRILINSNDFVSIDHQ